MIKISNKGKKGSLEDKMIAKGSHSKSIWETIVGRILDVSTTERHSP